MKNHSGAHSPGKPTSHSYASLIVGFAVSLVLTLSAYVLVVNHLFSKQVLLAVIAVLAIVQFMVQMRFFLHLGRESRPRWKLMVFLFMVLVVAILVFGSLWIMQNLNYHMAPTSSDTYILHDEGVDR